MAKNKSGGSGAERHSGRAAGTMEVQCPAGVGPGQMVQIQDPSGQTVQVMVPAGVAPGQMFQIQVQAPAAATVPPPLQPTTMEVQCPAGVGPGQMIQIPDPSGQMVQVAVPAGVGVGQTFQIQLQAPAATTNEKMVNTNTSLSAEFENPVEVAPPQDEATAPHVPKKALPRITFSRIFCCLVCTFIGFVVFHIWHIENQTDDMAERCGVCAWGFGIPGDGDVIWDENDMPYDLTDPRSYGRYRMSAPGNMTHGCFDPYLQAAKDFNPQGIGLKNYNQVPPGTPLLDANGIAEDGDGMSGPVEHQYCSRAACQDACAAYPPCNNTAPPCTCPTKLPVEADASGNLTCGEPCPAGLEMEEVQNPSKLDCKDNVDGVDCDKAPIVQVITPRKCFKPQGANVVAIAGLLFVMVFAPASVVAFIYNRRQKKRNAELLRRQTELRDRGRTAGEMGGVSTADLDGDGELDGHDHVAQHCVVSFPGGPEWQDLLDVVHERKVQDDYAWQRFRKSIGDFPGNSNRWAGPASGEDPPSLISCCADAKFISLCGGGKVQLLSWSCCCARRIKDLDAEYDGDLLREGDVDLACVFVENTPSPEKAHPTDKYTDDCSSKIGTTANDVQAVRVQNPMDSKRDGLTVELDLLPASTALAHQLSFSERRSHGGLQCYCARLGAMNSDLKCGYQDDDGCVRQGDDGCEWFEKWLANVDRAVVGGAKLHVIQKSDVPKDYWTLGQPLGHAQCLEVLILESRGLEYQTHASPTAFLEWLTKLPTASERIETKMSAANAMDYSRKIVLWMSIFVCFFGSIFYISDGGNCMPWNDHDGDGTAPQCCYETGAPGACRASGVYMSAFLPYL